LWDAATLIYYHFSSWLLLVVDDQRTTNRACMFQIFASVTRPIILLCLLQESKITLEHFIGT
jgi:hypothetical protein